MLSAASVVSAVHMEYRDLRKIPYLLMLIMNGVNDVESRQINITKVAAQLGTTPQNLSKILRKLESDGIISRSPGDKIEVRLTPKGSELLKQVITLIGQYLGQSLTVILRGQVVSGLGEGKFYMSLEGYRKQFVERLGINPYPGTLNVKINDEYIRERIYLEKLPGIIIEGFRNGSRSYGSVKCFKCSISGIPCAMLIIERTHHGPEVVEIVAEKNLRETLGLIDGSEVEITVNI
jgi:Transcriptional regulator of a riboflavin/FAD biosynthetic operon